MRALNATSLAITAFALAVVCFQSPTPANLLLSVALLAVLGALFALKPKGQSSAYALMVAAAGSAYAAGAAYASNALWLDEAPSAMLGLLAMGVVFMVIWRLKSRVRRLYASDLMVLSGTVHDGLQIVAGPDKVLVLFARVLALMPRDNQEHTFPIEGINVRPQPGPLGAVAQNINRLELELTYAVDDATCMRSFSVHNRDLFFQQGAEAAGKRLPAALAEKRFWIEVWRLALMDSAERIVRAAVHRSGMSAIAVSERRDEIEALVIEPLRAEAERIGLRLIECNILTVEPDEVRASLASREALLHALARAEEIKLTGDATAGAHAATLKALVEMVKAVGGQVPQKIVELVIAGTLSPAVLTHYVPAGFRPGDTMVDLQPRSNGRSGDPSRN